MNDKILIDTNAYAYFLKGNNNVHTYIINADTIYLSVIVIGELLAGFRGGSKYKANSELLNKFISKSSVSVYPVSEQTSDIFGEIKNNLKKNGTPIPVNDVWVAAQVFETGSKLVTFDKHFRAVPGLRIWDDL